MTAGVRKIPPPMVDPTSTATALQKPRRRGSRSPQRSAGGAGGEADMRGRIYCASARWRRQDRKSTRLNSSHGYISYAVFCLKKKKNKSTVSSSNIGSRVQKRDRLESSHHTM